MLSVQTLVRLSEAEAIADEWDALVARTPTATPFSSALWNVACWRHLGRGQLRILTFRQAGELVGVAPLYRVPGPQRQMRLIGMLSAPGYRGYPVSDYADLIAASGRESIVLSAFWSWLDDHRDQWWSVDFRLLPTGGVLASMPPGLRQSLSERRDRGTVLVATLPPTWAEYVKLVPANMRAGLERIPRKLQREHATQFERVSDPAQLLESLEHLFRLHGLRWSSVEQSGIFAPEAVRALHRDVAMRLLERGWLDLWLLRIDGEVAAAQYNLRLRDRVSYLFSGYLPERYDQYSPGRTLMAHTIRVAIEEGVRVYDFLRGDYEYKRRLLGESVEQVSIVAYSSPPARLAVELSAAGAQTLRSAYRRLRGTVQRRSASAPEVAAAPH